VRPALAEEDAPDGRAARQTWLAVPVVHAVQRREAARPAAGIAVI
jgi:hypothetical protein